MRLELTRAGLLVELANHYTTRGASLGCVCCVLCVGKEMWNTPGRRCEEPLDDRMAISGLEGWDSGDRPAVYCHIGKQIFLIILIDIAYFLRL